MLNLITGLGLCKDFVEKHGGKIFNHPGICNGWPLIKSYCLIFRFYFFLYTKSAISPGSIW